MLCQRIARIADEEELAAIPPETKTTPLRAAWYALGPFNHPLGRALVALL
jgi:phytoene/squalene synthetase